MGNNIQKTEKTLTKNTPKATIIMTKNHGLEGLLDNKQTKLPEEAIPATKIQKKAEEFDMRKPLPRLQSRSEGYNQESKISKPQPNTMATLPGTRTLEDLQKAATNSKGNTSKPRLVNLTSLDSDHEFKDFFRSDSIISQDKVLPPEDDLEWSYYSQEGQIFNIDMNLVDSEDNNEQEGHVEDLDSSSSSSNESGILEGYSIEEISLREIYGSQLDRANSDYGQASSVRHLRFCYDAEESDSDEGSKIVLDNFNEDRRTLKFKNKLIEGKK